MDLDFVEAILMRQHYTQVHNIEAIAAVFLRPLDRLCLKGSAEKLVFEL
jgi:hypothetical protein